MKEIYVVFKIIGLGDCFTYKAFADKEKAEAYYEKVRNFETKDSPNIVEWEENGNTFFWVAEESIIGGLVHGFVVNLDKKVYLNVSMQHKQGEISITSSLGDSIMEISTKYDDVAKEITKEYQAVKLLPNYVYVDYKNTTRSTVYEITSLSVECKNSPEESKFVYSTLRWIKPNEIVK